MQIPRFENFANSIRMLFAPHKRLRRKQEAPSAAVDTKDTWKPKHGCCVVSIDVASDDEHDLLMPMVVHLAAVYLARRCIRGASHIGGRTSVGPKRMVNIVVCFRTQSLSVKEVSHPSNLPVLPLLDERSGVAATYIIRSIAYRLNQQHPWHYLVSLGRRLHI